MMGFFIIIILSIAQGLKVPLSSIYRLKPSEYQHSHTHHYGTNNDHEKSSQRINFLLTKVAEIVTAMTPSLRKKTTNPSARYDQEQSSSGKNQPLSKKDRKNPVTLSFSASHRQQITLLNR